MSLLKWLGVEPEKVPDVVDALAKRGTEEVTKDVSTLAKKTLDALETGTRSIFTKLTEFESQLVSEIENRTDVLAEVRLALSKLRSIDAGPVADQPAAAASVKLSPAELQPAPAASADSTGSAPPVPPVTAS